jgi:precorrin-2 dehydrogenase/sirohydrochlorin ferrochelatase
MGDPRFEYPVFLDLAGRPALVVGGGAVALRKARALAEAGARVRVVAPSLRPEFAADGRFECVAAPYDRRHLEGARVVVAATDDEATNARVAADGRAAGALVNVVDRPALCDFIVPAQVRRGDLRVAISTGGASPMLARRLRERLEREFGPEYGTYLAVMREMRAEVLARDLAPETMRRVFERLAADDVLAAARGGADALRRAAQAAVADALGAGGPGGSGGAPTG